MQILVYWNEESMWSIQTISTIIAPRIPFEDYKIGMKVKAKYQGKSYTCFILEQMTAMKSNM